MIKDCGHNSHPYLGMSFSTLLHKILTPWEMIFPKKPTDTNALRCWKAQMRNTTALRGVYGVDRLWSECVWLTEVSACELGQNSERARLGGAGARLPILRILDQSLLTAIIGDEAGHVFHPQTVPGDMSPSWPLLFTTAAQHTTENPQMALHNACSTRRDD